MRILRVLLEAPSSRLRALERFYAEGLGLSRADDGAFQIGHTALAFRPVAEGEPFYHFALRVPRNRFEAARGWFGRRTELLPDSDSRETTFDFSNWNAEACYGHDPAGNIVELIAHGDLPEESSPEGDFAGAELLGVCELGLVGPDTRAMAAALERVGIGLWDGELAQGRLAFMGGRDGVLILAERDRGWLPTGRPAELHRVEVTVAGASDGEVLLPGTLHRVQTLAGA